jgi:hypothetical protein
VIQVTTSTADALDAKSGHNPEMNERQKLGSGKGGANVCLWVVAVSSGEQDRPIACRFSRSAQHPGASRFNYPQQSRFSISDGPFSAKCNWEQVLKKGLDWEAFGA